VCVDRLACKLSVQGFSQIAKACAAIEDEDLVVDTHLDARGIPTVSEVLSLRSRRRAAYTPEFYLHSHVSFAAGRLAYVPKLYDLLRKWEQSAQNFAEYKLAE